MKELVELFLAFARIGGLTFGGGYAMLPMLQREVVENKGLWDVSDTSKIANSIGIDFDNSWFNKYSFNYVMNMVRADNYEYIEKFCNEYPSTKQY